MTTLRTVLRPAAVIGAVMMAFTPMSAPAAGADKSAELLGTYCHECHNTTDWAGGLALDTLDLAHVSEDAKTWESVVRKLRGGLMPPSTADQPSQAEASAIVAFLEQRIDEKAAAHSVPGFVSLHRLNRTEYQRAVEQILGVQVDAAALLPRDERNEGFDNVASVLKVSPSFLDQYLWAAREVSLAAVGDAKTSRPAVTYRGGSEDARLHVPGMPLGTRGGVIADHYFPVDGEYTFNVGGGGFGGGGPRGGGPGGPGAGGPRGGGPGGPGAGGPGGPGGAPGGRPGIAPAAPPAPTSLNVLLIDGVPVWDSELAPPEQRAGRNIKVHVKAGTHKVMLASPAASITESDDMLRPLSPAGGGGFRGGGGGGGALEIVAPQAAMTNGILDTPSRARIFICRPANAAEELPCAQRILSRIAREAFRRPVAADDLAAPLRFFNEGRRDASFDAGIQQGIMAILASPKFLYRPEQLPEGLKAGDSYRIGDLDLASRLAFFLWSQGPDEELLRAAESGQLRKPKVLEAQVKRMLADARSRSLVTNFAFQWLLVDKADEIVPEVGAYPDFDAGLRSAMKKEMELFLDSILRSDRSVMDLLTARHTFVNERLALHYGLTGVRGNAFRRIEWQDPNRYGLLGKGNVLMATSYGDRTSPVVRGSWVLENLIGTPPTPPPPGVEALAEGRNDLGRPLTVRERLEAHRDQPSCKSCHGIIDPLGFALENFDVTGKWREVDRASLSPIDARERLPSGQMLDGPEALRAMLIARPDQFAQTLTEKLMIFALGRSVEYHDMPAVRAIVRAAAREDYRFGSIVLNVVRSDAFQMRQVPDPAIEDAATAGTAALSPLTRSPAH